MAAAPQELSIQPGPNGTTLVNVGQTVLAIARYTGSGGVVPGGSPFGGTPASLPGVIQAENFDNGGEGSGYHTSNLINHTGNLYRTSGVTIENSGDVGGGYNVGFLYAGDSLTYTVNFSASFTYDFSARVADVGTGASFHLQLDGLNVTGTLATPDTGGYQTYQTVTRPSIAVTAGTHTLQLVMDSNNAFGYAGNFNSFAFSPSAIQNPGTISGNVYHDTNGNGIRDNGEAAFPGQQVYLDIPGIGHFVPGDPTPTADAVGNYTFTNVPAGNYLVRITVPSGTTQTQPGAIFAYQYYIQLAGGANILGKDFGLQ